MVRGRVCLNAVAHFWSMFVYRSFQNGSSSCCNRSKATLVLQIYLTTPEKEKNSTARLLLNQEKVGTEENAQRWISSSSIFKSGKDMTGPPTEECTEKDSVTEKDPSKNAKENLINLIGGMKVELSSKKKLKAMKMSRLKEQTPEQHNDLESASSMYKKATEDNMAKSKSLTPEIIAAASAVASSLPFDKKQTESELLQQLRKHDEETDAQKRGETNKISNIISEMRIGKSPLVRPGSRPANQIRFDDDGKGYTLNNRGITQEFAGVKRRGLYIGKRLNIFTAATTPDEVSTELVSKPTLWDLELANQIASASKRLPRNGFEEMIQWTKEGKLWEFPINNEAGLEEEQKVEFHEHVFLEKHLEDFTKQGPIRHFMELVICGLSRNPYLTVKQKTEHIQWYYDYFQQKEDILRESGLCLN
ncbi:small ribosomal subunit protein mS31 isoform X2 [Pleurodeles waltl]|uniref:small ribosomal subunit protein mS31 isoform X2 n=1 Tax=Pleurodeles waltl TaxID=8319 RepID=UPI00370970EF